MADELDRLYDTMRDGFAGINARLDVINGRTRKNENDISVLHERVGSGKAAAWGGGVGAFVVTLVEGIRWLIGR